MPFESLGAVSYSSFIVTVAVSIGVCELFSVNTCYLGNWVRGRSRSLTMAPFDRPYSTFYWSAIVNIMIVLVSFSSYLTLKSGLEVTHGH